MPELTGALKTWGPECGLVQSAVAVFAARAGTADDLAGLRSTLE